MIVFFKVLFFNMYWLKAFIFVFMIVFQFFKRQTKLCSLRSFQKTISARCHPFQDIQANISLQFIIIHRIKPTS